MSENATSAGTIFLDLKILDTLQSQLQTISKRAEQSAQAGFTHVGEVMSESMQKPMERAGESMKQALSKPMEQAANATKAPLNKMKDQVQKTEDDIQKIAERAAKRVNAVEQNVKLPAMAPRIPSATATAIRRGKDDSNTVQKPLNVSEVFKPSADAMELLRQKMQNVNLQMDSERQKLAQLEAAFVKVNVGTKAWDDLSAKITAAESKLISMQQTANAAKEKVEEPALKMAQAAEKAAARQKAAAEKASFARQRTAQKAASVVEKQQERMAQASQRTAKIQEKAAQRHNMAMKGIARTQANSFLSAAASQAKGTVQIGVLGRTAFTSLRGIGTALPMLAAFGVFKVLQKGFETANQSSKQFQNSLNSLKANLQVAFTPIYQAILPALNAMVNGLATAAKYVASFISALFGKTYAQSIAAGKKIQNAQKAAGSKSGGSNNKSDGAVASFDQIHALQKDSSSGAGGSGADASGVDLNALNTKGSEAAAALANKFKAAWAGIASTFNGFVVNPIKENLSKLDAPVAKFKALFFDIGTQCKAWLSPLSDWFNNDFKNALDVAISDGMTILAGFADTAAMVADTIWKAFKPVINWFVKDGLPTLTKVWVEASNTAVSAFEVIKTVFDTLWHGVVDPALQFISKALVDVLNIFKNLWDKYGATTFANIRKTLESSKAIFMSMWNSVLKPIFDKLFEVLNKLWDEHIKPLIAQVGELIAKFVNGAMDIYNQFVAPMYKWFIETLGPPITKVINIIIDAIGEFTAHLYDAASGVLKALGGVIDFVTGIFTGDWKKAWQGVQDIFKGCFSALEHLAKAPIDCIKKLIDEAVSAISKVITDWWKNHVEPWFNRDKWAKLSQMAVAGLVEKYNEFKKSFDPIREWWNKNVSPWFTADKWKSLGKQAVDALLAPFKNIQWPKLKKPELNVSYDSSGAGAKIGKFFGLPGQPVFDLKWLARGGIVDQPQLAMIGERGKEAVMPLENNTGWIRQLAQQVASYIGGGGSLTEDALYRVGKRLLAELPKQTATFIVEINKRVIAQEVIKELNRQNVRYNPVSG